MATQTLYPQHNSRSKELGVEDKNNMYTSASSSTYGYVFYLDDLYGFPQYESFYIDLEFDISLPENAVVDGVSNVRIKGRQNNVIRGSKSISLMADNHEIAYSTAFFNSSAQSYTLTVFNSSVKDIGTAERVYMRVPYTLNNVNLNGDLFIYGAQFTLSYFIPDAYVKEGDVWMPVKSAYKKISNVWISQNVSTVFDPNTHYEKGE